MNQEYVKCPNCGTENLSTFATCSNCGTLLPEVKAKKHFKIKLNINLTEVTKLIIGIISIIIFIIGCLTSYRILKDGIQVLGSESASIVIFSIIEAIAPISFLVAGILSIIKRKSIKSSSNILFVILYFSSALLYIIPQIAISDIFYMILGVTKFSPLSISSIVAVEFAIIYLYIFLLDKIQKKSLKIIISIVTLALIITVFILILNFLSPSEFLLPDY